MLLPQTPPKKKARPKGQPSPYSLFFAAFLAYMFGAPFGLVLFLVGLGIIFWRVQASARNMDKLPPLPPAKPDHELDISGLKKSSGEMPAPRFPDDTRWGRSQPEPLTETEVKPLPERGTQARQAEQRRSEPVPQPRPVTQPQPVMRTQDEWKPAAATIAPLPQRAAGRSTDDARHQPGHRTPGLGVNLATQAGLRHAMVAMTVLGPCRSLEPYQDDPMHTGFPGPGKTGKPDARSASRSLT